MLRHCLIDVLSMGIWARPLAILWSCQMSHSRPAVCCAAGTQSGLPNVLSQLSAACSAWFRGWLNQRSSMTGASTSLGRLQPPCAVDQKVLHDIVGALYKHSISLSNEVRGRLCPGTACK